MNKDILEGKWEQLKGLIQSKWGEITDDELSQIKGDTKRFHGILQEKYGYEREEAEKMYKEVFGEIDEEPEISEDAEKEVQTNEIFNESEKAKFKEEINVIR